MSITGDNYGPIIKSLDWTLFGLSSIVVSLRLYTRTWIIRKPGWDDATMALSQTLVAVRKGFVIEKVKYGLGKHRDELSGPTFSKYQHFDYLEWLTVFFILALSKISFCLFLLRISQFNKLKKVIWVLIGGIISFTLPLFLMFLLQCDPIRRYWHRDIDGHCFPKLTVMKIMILQGSFSVITDLICAMLPAFLFRELKISRRSKIALCILMGLGVITAMACIVRTSFSYQVLSTDVSWVGVPNAIARIVEIHTGNIAASAPILKPFCRYVHARWKGADPNDLVFRRAPPPSLSHWLSRFWITPNSRTQTDDRRPTADAKTKKSSKSSEVSEPELSSNRTMDLPLQGIPANGKASSKFNPEATAEPGPHNNWPLPNEFPLQDLTQEGKQTRRAEIEEDLGSISRNTKEMTEGNLDNGLDLGSWKAKTRWDSELGEHRRIEDRV